MLSIIWKMTQILPITIFVISAILILLTTIFDFFCNRHYICGFFGIILNICYVSMLIFTICITITHQIANNWLFLPYVIIKLGILLLLIINCYRTCEDIIFELNLKFIGGGEALPNAYSDYYKSMPKYFIIQLLGFIMYLGIELMIII